MKKVLILCLLGSSVLMGVEVKKAAAEESESSAIDIKACMQMYGWMIGVRAAGLPDLNLNEEEIESFIEGIRKAAKDEALGFDLSKIGPQMQKYIQDKAEANAKVKEGKLAAEANEHRVKGKAFLDEVAKKPNVKQSESGLYYEIVEEGTGVFPTEKDLLTVNYEGKLIDGTVFDSSLRRGEPATFRLNFVIPGFKEGLKMLKKGGKAKLYIPADLAYGNNKLPTIPPGSTLIFEIELLDIQPVQKGKGAKPFKQK